ncbi:C3H1-type domain-containing protein [Entamoeba marina]
MNRLSLMFFSSKESSTFNSYLNDETEAVPTEEERLYFESLNKIDSTSVEKVLDDEDDDLEFQLPNPPYQSSRCQSNPNPMLNELNPFNSDQSLNFHNYSTDSYNNKWRTQPCLFYQKYGYCRKGDACNYSHDIPVTGKQFISVDKLYRTKPCKYFFKTGTCRKGDNCNYSHDLSVC